MITKLKEPDFLQIPIQVVKDTSLQPVDRLVYGVLYWIEHLRDGVCAAGNLSIGQVIGVSGGTVENSLYRLELAEHIKRTYKDKNKRHRIMIETQICYRKVGKSPPLLDGSKVIQTHQLMGPNQVPDPSVDGQSNIQQQQKSNNNNSVGGGIMDSESRITTTPEASKGNEPYKIRKDPLSLVVMGWKLIGGWKKDDRAWDKTQWARTSKPAMRLLEKFRGDWGAAVDYMDLFAAAYKEKRLSFTIETMDAKFDEWRRDHGDPRPQRVEPRQEVSEPRPAFNDPDAAENRSRLAGLLGVVQFGKV